MKVLKRVFSPWVREEGPEGDIALSTRVRLARNLQGHIFPERMSHAEGQQILSRLASKFDGQQTSIGQFSFLRMNALTDLERRLLVEKHLISPQLIKKHDSAGCLVSEQEEISVMVNEEDHLRIQCLVPGLEPMKALETAMHMDSWLENDFPFAFDPEIGYLTSCPSNIGTGLRISVMMHLPGLVHARKLDSMLQALGKRGVVVRGVYGEGSKSFANLYQISNQMTLGKSEKEIAGDLLEAVQNIMMYERDLRTQILQGMGDIYVKNRVFRALGVVGHARMICLKEAVDMLSEVRLGIDYGFISGLSPKLFNELIVAIQPTCLEVLAGQPLNEEERDIFRAKLLRDHFNKLNK